MQLASQRFSNVDVIFYKEIQIINILSNKTLSQMIFSFSIIWKTFLITFYSESLNKTFLPEVQNLMYKCLTDKEKKQVLNSLELKK